MATQVQFRRGTTTQNNAFTGAIGEITYDTEVKTLRLHDGSTAGGGSVVTINAGTQTLTNKTLSTNSVWQGTAVGLAYGGTNANITAAAGAVVYSTSSALAVTAAGTSGQVLTSAGSTSPTWTSQSSLTVGTATTATTATNIAGGSAGQLIIQQDTNLSTFIPAGAAGTFLRSAGAGYAPEWAAGQVTYGSTTVAFGQTSTSLAGLTSIDATSGATSFFATPTSPVVFAAATSLTLGYGSTASSTTNISTGAVGSGNTKTINIGTGGAAGSTTNINLGDADGGTVTVNKDLVVSGNLTVSGTTTTVNSTTLDVADINITVAKGAANAAAANGAGLTVDGANATMLYTSATDSWNFNKPIINSVTSFTQVASGTSAQRPGSAAVGMVRYNSDISSFEGYASGAWSSLGGVKSVDGYTYIIAETSAGASNGDLDFYAENGAGNAATQIGQWNRTNLKDYTGTLVGTQTTQNVFNATATTINAFGASTATTIGATTGTHTIRNATVSLPNATAITTGQTTVALLNTTATTVNAFGAATTLSLGAATGTTTVNNTLTTAGTIELGNASDTTIARSAAGVVTIEGVEIVTLSRSQTLTNKTLTSPVISSISNTGTLTLPTSTDTLVGRATTDTLTNKTLTFPVIDNIREGYTSTVTAAGTTTLTSSSNHYQRFTGTTTQTIVLPVTSTLAAGVSYHIENNSTGNLTVNSSGGNLVITVIPGVTVQCMCIGTTLTTAADWDPEYVEFATITGTGSAVLATSPTLTTPNIGVATATSVTASGGFLATSANPFVYTATTVASNVTIPTNYNGMSVGPITVNNNITVTIPDGSAWTIV